MGEGERVVMSNWYMIRLAMCRKGKHEFQIAGKPYHKKHGDALIQFTCIFCKRCGSCKEIISADYKPLNKGDATESIYGRK